MYTSDSQHLNKEFESKVRALIEIKINSLKATPTAQLAVLFENEVPKYAVEEVIDSGFRWKDSKQVYQALVMQMSDYILKEIGNQDFKHMPMKLRVMANVMVDKENSHILSEMIEKAVIRAAGTDYYYSFEKRWE